MTNAVKNSEFDLSLPIKAIPALYNTGFKKALQMFCTPIADANDGDFVGVALDLVSYRHGMEVHPLVEFIVARGNGKFSRTHFRDLSLEERKKVSLGSMTAQASLFNTHKLWENTDDLEPGDAEAAFLHAYITPEFLLVARDNYEDEILDYEISNCVLSQNHIISCFLAVLPYAVESSHDVIEHAKTASEISILANALFRVPHPEDELKMVPLAAPDLSSAVNGS
jgi:hypothetical protein